MELTIRLMEESDNKAIQHIAQMSWHDTYEGVAIQDACLETAYSEERF